MIGIVLWVVMSLVADETALIYVGSPTSFDTTNKRSIPRVDALVDRQSLCTGAAVSTSLEIADVRLLTGMYALVLYKMSALAECSCTAFEIASEGQLTRVNPVVLNQFVWCLTHFTASPPRACEPIERKQTTNHWFELVTKGYLGQDASTKRV